MEEYRKIGNKWNTLSALFPGRTGNTVRNRCMMLLRRKWVSPARDEDGEGGFLTLCEPGNVDGTGTGDFLQFFFSGPGPENDSA
jgi:hypothetical protein